jgi:hypothetical protein
MIDAALVLPLTTDPDPEVAAAAKEALGETTNN